MRFRTKPVHRGEVAQLVNSTGTVQPVLSVQVGAFVSGPIQNVCVDFNDRVKKDAVLAVIDPTIYEATVAQTQAAVNSAKASLLQAKANLHLAEANLKRDAEMVRKGAIAPSQWDADTATVQVDKAIVAVDEAAIKQAEATLKQAQINLGYCAIKSPVDGVVIDRKVDPGQTLAAQFQTPVMFLVAPDLEKKVYVWASVDEADIGLIREAQKRKQPVNFTVDAYPADSFIGHIFQVRLNPATVSNVVTYTVLVEAANAGLKLLPGMTANLAFQIENRANVLVVPNAALRFRPKPDWVRKSDQAILEGLSEGDAPAGERKDSAAPRSQRTACVWVMDGDQLAAVEIVTGLAGKHGTEVVSGGLAEGQDVVVGK